MIYLFISVCCNVLVSVLLKLAKRYRLDINQAITWNYSMAAVLTLVVFGKPQVTVPLSALPWTNYFSLGILLPLVFIAIAASIRFTGIIRTELAQRLSLFIPLAASFIVFGEELPLFKMAGIALGFVAILLSIPLKGSKSAAAGTSTWIYPVGVFLGMGLIDSLFKQLSADKALVYTTSLLFVYVLAFVISLGWILALKAAGKLKFEWINVVCGWILGVFNFCNILFYLKAHQALPDRPSLVFTAMNVGVIVLGAMVGLIVFREKLSLLNKIGIAVALASIFLLALHS